LVTRQRHQSRRLRGQGQEYPKRVLVLSWATHKEVPMPVALVTGASKGLGLALTRALSESGWDVVVDARDGDALRAATAGLRGVIAIPGDVADPTHRDALVAAVKDLGRLDVLVNNASTLGASPLPRLDVLPLDVYRRTLDVNVIAPLAVVQAVLPLLRVSGGRVLNITSDAGVEGYETWGGYGSAKAALEQLSNVLAAEEPEVRVYWVDPGDMRTEMHQDAFPGEDISDRPSPDDSVPGILALIDGDWPSGRYTARALVTP
jgi:NAD(P)-dependent dehydrogenase (short-subunit alcohol dehydrogenase family)